MATVAMSSICLNNSSSNNTALHIKLNISHNIKILNIKDHRGQHLEVLALASNGQVLAFALVMQAMALALIFGSRSLAKAKTILKLQKSPDRFQTNDPDFADCNLHCDYVTHNVH